MSPWRVRALRQRLEGSEEAGLLAGRTQDRPAPLAVRYEVVDLVAARLEAVPRANLLRRVAEVERSVQAGTLP